MLNQITAPMVEIITSVTRIKANILFFRSSSLSFVIRILLFKANFSKMGLPILFCLSGFQTLIWEPVKTGGLLEQTSIQGHHQK